MRRVSGATGAVVLSTALLISGAGGAVAVADTGTGDSSSSSSGASDTAGEGSASTDRDSDASDRESIRTTLRDVVRSATSAFDSRPDRVFGPSGEDDRAAEEVSDDVSDDLIDDASDLIDEVGDEVGEDVAVGDIEAEDPVAPQTPAESDVPEVPEAETPVDPESDASEAGGAGGSAGGSDSPESTGSGSATPYGPVSQEQTVASSPAVRQVTPIFHVVRTMTSVVVTLGSAAASIPPVVFALPFSQTPVSDVVALLEALLTSVGESATAIANLPSDLVAMLGTGATVPHPIVVGSHSDYRMAPLSVGSTPIAGPQPTSPLLPITSDLLSGNTGDLPGFGTFTPTVLMAHSAPPPMVPAALSARLGEHQSLVDRAFGAMLLPLSLWALATGALPGLAGLLVVFGAGIRVGYRQAKAGFAVKVAGIARFARPGPMGVVRAGSLVALHQRALRPEGPRTLRLVRGDHAA